MSGHSKWSTIKRQKAVTDKVRGKLFTKLGQAITIAARLGQSDDPNTNIKLRFAIDKAKTANMPKVNIERAILRGVGKSGESNQLFEVTYEGFGPKGAAIIIEGVTDNKQRTVARVKNVFKISGGSLGETGSVNYLFEKLGTIEIDINKNTKNKEELFEIGIESGAEDIDEEGDVLFIYTKPKELHEIIERLKEAQVVMNTSEIIFKPKNEIELAQESDRKRVLALLENLEEIEDIHNTYSNLSL